MRPLQPNRPTTLIINSVLNQQQRPAIILVMDVVALSRCDDVPMSIEAGRVCPMYEVVQARFAWSMRRHIPTSPSGRKRAAIVVPEATGAGLVPRSGQMGAILGEIGLLRLSRAARLGTITG